MSTARSFNGTSSDWLSNTTGYNSGSAGPWTMMCWFKSADVTQASKYFMSGNGGGDTPAFLYGFVNDGSGHAQIEMYNVFRTNSQITILNTNWHHIAYRYLGAASEFAYFLDGTKTVINASLTATLETTSGLQVGSATLGNNAFSGSLAEFAFWSTNLTDGNIAAIANTNGSTLPSNFTTNLLGYWPLGLASPDTDQSSANHPLTVNGTTIVAGPYISTTTLPIFVQC